MFLNLLGGISIKQWILAAVALSAVVLYGNYKFMSHKIGILQEDNVVLEESIVNARTAIAQWKIDKENMVKDLEILKLSSEKANKEVDRLNDIFLEHDLKYLAQKKPGLIQRSINRGTSASFRMLECASGSEKPNCVLDSSGEDPTP